MTNESPFDLRALVVDVVRQDFAPSAPPGVLERVVQLRAGGRRVILPVTAPGDEDASRHAAGLGGTAGALRRKLPWTIGLLLGAAGMAVALPGSPIRGWIEGRLRRSPAAVSSAVRVPVVTEPAPGAGDTIVAGLSVPLADGTLLVAVDATAPFQIRLRLTDARELEARGIGEAAGAVFRARSNGIGISRVAGGELQLDVPRAAPRFELRVRGVAYVVKDGARLQVLAPAADTAGDEIVIVARP